MARRKRRKSGSVTIPRTGGRCSAITFHSRGGKAVEVVRCKGRKLRAHNRRQCRDRNNLFTKCGTGRKKKRR